MSWWDLAGSGVTSAPSRVDSRRFGLEVLRTLVGDGETDDREVARTILADIARHEPDITIARWPARLTRVASQLTLSGVRVVPADLLVYWRTAVRQDVMEIDPAVSLLADVPDLADQFPAAVRATFAGYRHHYSASTVFPDSATLDGYVEWASTVAVGTPERCVVATDGSRLMAFATVRLAPEGDVAEVELAGTVPGNEGKGWYSRLLRGALHTIADSGATELVISTQGWNVAVQSAWASIGLRPMAAFITAHLTVGPPD